MKLINKTQESNVTVQKESNSTAFQLSSSAAFLFNLSDIYSDKMLAAIREPICNAWDSHTKSGIKDNIVVTFHDDYIEIRDFGLGIPHEDFTDIYGTYGDSTKGDSLTETGGFGLGCKSPFAYSDSFTVVNRNDGKQIVHLLTKSSELDGKPAMIKIVEMPTTEQGISVQIPYKHDGSFFAAQEELYAMVDIIKDTAMFSSLGITLKSELTEVNIHVENEGEDLRPIIEDMVPERLYINTGVAKNSSLIYPFTTGSTELNTFFIVLLNVAYSINLGMISNKSKETLLTIKEMFSARNHRNSVNTKNYFFKVDPTKVGVTPNREMISYSEITVDYLDEVIAKMYEEINDPSIKDITDEHTEFLKDKSSIVKHVMMHSVPNGLNITYFDRYLLSNVEGLDNVYSKDSNQKYWILDTTLPSAKYIRMMKIVNDAPNDMDIPYISQENYEQNNISYLLHSKDIKTDDRSSVATMCMSNHAGLAKHFGSNSKIRIARPNSYRRSLASFNTLTTVNNPGSNHDYHGRHYHRKETAREVLLKVVYISKTLNYVRENKTIPTNLFDDEWNIGSNVMVPGAVLIVLTKKELEDKAEHIRNIENLGYYVIDLVAEEEKFYIDNPPKTVSAADSEDSSERVKLPSSYSLKSVIFHDSVNYIKNLSEVPEPTNPVFVHQASLNNITKGALQYDTSVKHDLINYLKAINADGAVVSTNNREIRMNDKGIPSLDSYIESTIEEIITNDPNAIKYIQAAIINIGNCDRTYSRAANANKNIIKEECVRYFNHMPSDMMFVLEDPSKERALLFPVMDSFGDRAVKYDPDASSNLDFDFGSNQHKYLLFKFFIRGLDRYCGITAKISEGLATMIHNAVMGLVTDCNNIIAVYDMFYCFNSDHAYRRDDAQATILKEFHAQHTKSIIPFLCNLKEEENDSKH